MKPIRVALLGATSHIAKGLIACWSGREERELLLYARSPQRVSEFLGQLPAPPKAQVCAVGEFGADQLDVVINCVGVGSPSKLEEDPADVFAVTARFDDLIIDYLVRHPETLYVNLSSGAAYGVDFSEPVDQETVARFELNDLKGQQFYGIAKLHAEAKHRALAKYSIVDVRVFGYFSRFIDLSERYLLSEIVSCLKHSETFVTTPAEIWRDVLHPHDLATLIDACIAHRPLNRAFDAYSCKEASKSEILDFFARSYGLKYRIDDSNPLASCGQKSRYYPVSRKAGEIGYRPAFTSIEGIKAETSALVAGWEPQRFGAGSSGSAIV